MVFINKAGILKDYYQILGLSKKASALQVFKEFKARFLKDEEPTQAKQQVLTAYIVLQEHSRKYYDILLEQHKNNRPLSPKYVAIIEMREKKAKEVLENTGGNSKVLIEPLVDYPWSGVWESFFDMFMEVYYSWIAIGLVVTVASIITAVFTLKNGNWIAFVVCLVFSALGIVLHNRGILKYKKQKVDWIISESLD